MIMGNVVTDPVLGQYLRLALSALESKKAFSVVVLDVAEHTSIADAFVICSVGSLRQAQAVCDEVERLLKEHSRRPLAVEGYSHGGWILMDYGDFLLHIFDEEHRSFYALERLWRDAPEVSAFLRSG